MNLSPRKMERRPPRASPGSACALASRSLFRGISLRFRTRQATRSQSQGSSCSLCHGTSLRLRRKRKIIVLMTISGRRSRGGRRPRVPRKTAEMATPPGKLGRKRMTAERRSQRGRGRERRRAREAECQARRSMTIRGLTRRSQREEHLSIRSLGKRSGGTINITRIVTITTSQGGKTLAEAIQPKDQALRTSTLIGMTETTASVAQLEVQTDTMATQASSLLKDHHPTSGEDHTQEMSATLVHHIPSEEVQVPSAPVADLT